MEQILAFDRSLFHKINLEWTSSWADQVFPAITDLHKVPAFILPLIAGLLVLIFYRYQKRGGAVFLFFALALATADLIGGKLIKPFFARPRPNLAGLEHVLRCEHYNGFSFTSNHAINMFCAAAFLSYFFPRARWLLLFSALMIGYSRVYCGVHYPMDVLGGAVLGSVVGAVFAILLIRSKLSPFQGETWQKS